MATSRGISGLHLYLSLAASPTAKVFGEKPAGGRPLCRILFSSVMDKRTIRRLSGGTGSFRSQSSRRLHDGFFPQPSRRWLAASMATAGEPHDVPWNMARAGCSALREIRRSKAAMKGAGMGVLAHAPERRQEKRLVVWDREAESSAPRPDQS